VLAQQGWKLADQLLIATGTVGEGAPGHGEGRKVAGTWGMHGSVAQGAAVLLR
jgi:hypothetical protein